MRLKLPNKRTLDISCKVSNLRLPSSPCPTFLIPKNPCSLIVELEKDIAYQTHSVIRNLEYQSDTKEELQRSSLPVKASLCSFLLARLWEGA